MLNYYSGYRFLLLFCRESIREFKTNSHFCQQRVPRFTVHVVDTDDRPPKVKTIVSSIKDRYVENILEKFRPKTTTTNPVQSYQLKSPK